MRKLLLLLILLSPTAIAADFNAYWNKGKAELTSYTLEQARYGEIHQGSAVLIFVTEPFNVERQVKADEFGEGDIQVLKLNQTRKFNTGIYPYSMMLSVFTPLDAAANPRTLKTTVSVQEWCGQVFTQLNLRDGKYAATQFSYFETDGDQQLSAGDAILEDEVWTRIRISPEALQTGELNMIPSGFHARLHHRAQQPEKVIATLKTHADDPAQQTYQLAYPVLNRKMRIHFETAFPHAITGWEEIEPSGKGTLTTRATRLKSMMLDYWNHHDVVDLPLREQLGLSKD